MRHKHLNFFRGCGSVLTLFPPPRFPLKVERAISEASKRVAIKNDYEAIADAWNATGSDLQEALIVFHRSHDASTPERQLTLW